MQMYQDMALLNDIQKKNERTKLLLSHSSQKILVVEESQNYIMKMLFELETDLSQFLSHSGARVGGGQYRGDQDVMPGLRARNSERLFQRLDGLCLEMQDNDSLIADAMKKMNQIEISKSDEAIERATAFGGGGADSEDYARQQIHQTIQETIGGFVQSLNVIDVESRELAAKTNEIKRKIDLSTFK